MTAHRLAVAGNPAGRFPFFLPSFLPSFLTPPRGHTFRADSPGSDAPSPRRCSRVADRTSPPHGEALRSAHELGRLLEEESVEGRIALTSIKDGTVLRPGMISDFGLTDDEIAVVRSGVMVQVPITASAHDALQHGKSVNLVARASETGECEVLRDALLLTTRVESGQTTATVVVSTDAVSSLLQDPTKVTFLILGVGQAPGDC